MSELGHSRSACCRLGRTSPLLGGCRNHGLSGD
jgi:hypothetical protein